MAMTTSEERSSGGLIGSVGVVTTDNGKISIGDFRSNKECIPYGAGDPTEDEQRIFEQWGPLKMSFDIRDLAVYPDTCLLYTSGVERDVVMIAPGSPTRKAGRNHAVWLQHPHIACITVYSGV